MRLITSAITSNVNIRSYVNTGKAGEGRKPADEPTQPSSRSGGQLHKILEESKKNHHFKIKKNQKLHSLEETKKTI